MFGRCCIVVILGCMMCMPVSMGAAQKSSSKSTAKKGAEQRNGGQAGASPLIDVSRFDAETIGRQILDKTNVERRRAGLPELVWNPALANAATGHSADMARRNYFSHKSKGLFRRSDLRDRTTKAGHSGGLVAENIAMLPTYRSQQYGTSVQNGQYRNWVQTDGCTYDQLSDWAMEQWMNSPGHRANILHPGLRSLGVGAALGQKDGVPYVYLTQNFAGN